MDSVVDKEQRLGEGRSEVEDRNLDLEDLMDDEEVALNLPRKGAGERDPPGEKIRHLPGDTASGGTVTQQTEWFRTEPPSGARPNWNRPARPIPVIEEPRGPGQKPQGVWTAWKRRRAG